VLNDPELGADEVCIIWHLAGQIQEWDLVQSQVDKRSAGRIPARSHASARLCR
jgi:hypothetical protein